MLVDFNKGPAASYDAEAHGNGIYQCTDTGDTYIFGIKNGGKNGLIPSTDLPEPHKNLIKDMLSLSNTPSTQVLPSWQAFVDSVTWEGQQSLNFYDGPISAFGVVSTENQDTTTSLGFMNMALCCLSWGTSGENKSVVFVVFSPNTAYGIYDLKLIISVQDGVGSVLGNLQTYLSADDNNIFMAVSLSQTNSAGNGKVNYDHQINFKLKGDGTKYLNDQGKYTSPVYPMAIFPFADWADSRVIPDNYIQPLTEAFTSGKLICMEVTDSSSDDKLVVPVNWKKTGDLYKIYFVTQGMDTQGEFQMMTLTLDLNLSEKTATPAGQMPVVLKYGGSVTKYLSESGTYQELPTKVTDPDILSRISALESELQGVNALADEILTLTE